MANNPGAWRDRARDIIVKTHAAIPEGATRAEIVERLRLANPSPNCDGDEYKIWLDEKQRYLFARFESVARDNPAAALQVYLKDTKARKQLSAADSATAQGSLF